MVSSFRITILPFLLVAISSVSAAPWARIDHTRHATHRLRHINEGLTLESYHPRGSFKVQIATRDNYLVLLIPCHRRHSDQQVLRHLKRKPLLLLPHSQEVAALPSASMTPPSLLFSRSLVSTQP